MRIPWLLLLLWLLSLVAHAEVTPLEDNCIHLLYEFLPRQYMTMNYSRVYTICHDFPSIPVGRAMESYFRGIRHRYGIYIEFALQVLDIFKQFTSEEQTKCIGSLTFWLQFNASPSSLPFISLCRIATNPSISYFVSRLIRLSAVTPEFSLEPPTEREIQVFSEVTTKLQADALFLAYFSGVADQQSSRFHSVLRALLRVQNRYQFNCIVAVPNNRRMVALDKVSVVEACLRYNDSFAVTTLKSFYDVMERLGVYSRTTLTNEIDAIRLVPDVRVRKAVLALVRSTPLDQLKQTNLSGLIRQLYFIRNDLQLSCMKRFVKSRVPIDARAIEWCLDSKLNIMDLPKLFLMWPDANALEVQEQLELPSVRECITLIPKEYRWRHVACLACTTSHCLSAVHTVVQAHRHTKYLLDIGHVSLAAKTRSMEQVECIKTAARERSRLFGVFIRRCIDDTKTSKDDTEFPACPICLEDVNYLDSGGLMSQRPSEWPGCNHLMHTRCRSKMRSSNLKHKNRCPLCLRLDR